MSKSQDERPNSDSAEYSSNHRDSTSPYEDDSLSYQDEDELPAPPPPYISFDDGELQTEAQVTADGRLNINIDIKSGALSKLMLPALRSQLDLQDAHALPPPFSTISRDNSDCPTPILNIVIQLVGSRGDIQPFIALGLTLQRFGHRVRIATHQAFQQFVEQMGLEFFNIGGDPVELMAFMVNNPRMVPSFARMVKGEIQAKRKMMRRIMEGCWRSCIAPGPVPDKGTEKSGGHNSTAVRPFVADAIIANPPSFAHIHCAEKLGIPLHLVFTMPWSPTQAFPHPLANIQSSNADAGLANYLSYILVEIVTWQGIGGVVNSFRRSTLRLQPIDSTWAPNMLSRLRIPQTYCWSPALIPKPKEWGPSITVSGYCFLPLASNYSPPASLLSFLETGPPPIYIGFGSIVVANPPALTALIFEAVARAGVRAIVSQGWGDVGSAAAIPPNVFIVGNCPHDWLFRHVACVVHHGGSGTTAAGIAAGRPTVVVPFFGDQPFWGQMIAQADAGPSPIPFRALTAELLANAISEALSPAATLYARELAESISTEDGPSTTMAAFHDALPLGVMGCALAPQRAAVWYVRKYDARLSTLAVAVLIREGLLSAKQCELYRPVSYNLNHGPWEPLSGGVLAVTDLFYNTFKGIGEIGMDFGRIPSAVSSFARKDRTGPSGSAPNTNTDTEVSREMEPESSSRSFGSGSLKGSARIFKSAMRAPGAFSLALAQGAHNAPKLWGDKSVRPQDNITGAMSGVVAGVKELTLGTYDGLAGLVMQPISGARENGAAGFVQGVGRGVVGFPVKWFAAMSGSCGYPLHGIDVEITRAFTSRRSGRGAVVEARLAQGEMELEGASEEERAAVVEGWLGVLGEWERNGKGKWGFGRRRGKGKGRLKGGSGVGEDYVGGELEEDDECEAESLVDGEDGVEGEGMVAKSSKDV